MLQRRLVIFTRAALTFLGLATTGGRLGAQEAPPKLETGASVAVTFSKFGGSATENPKLQYGFGVGGFLTMHLSRNLAFQPEFQYVLKGSRFAVDSIRTSVIVGYLQIPLLAKFIIPAAQPNGISPHFYGGIAGAVRLDCRLNVKNGSSSVSQTCGNTNEPPPKRWDASAVVGAGANVRMMFVDVRFDLGLTRIGSTSGQEDVKNRTLYLMVGTAFRAPQ